jgi:serine/threonine-protein kinase HipA
MNRCPITYQPCGEDRYSPVGFKILSPGLRSLHDLEYTAEEQRREAFNRASKMSIQGVQPKLSAVLNIRDGRFEIVDQGGKFILKPQHHIFREMPENEDLTMKLAGEIGLEIPPHGLIWSRDGTLTYFIRRFDRKGRHDRIPVEDLAQLAGLNRDTKYQYSMEGLVKLIDAHCTFPAIEKIKLFKMVLFNFLVGNEDMHLKNFSIITRNNKVTLSPCYDLVNTTIEYRKPDEQIALPLKGKKKNLTRNDLVNYFGRERCDLTAKSMEKVLETIAWSVPSWFKWIGISFLSMEMKEKYLRLLESRLEVLRIR